MDFYSHEFEPGPDMLPRPNEAMRHHLDQSTDELLTWPSGDELAVEKRRLCVVRLCQVEANGFVEAGDIFTMEPFDSRGMLIEDNSFEVFVFPNCHGGVYAVNALRFAALKGDAGYEDQQLEERIIRMDPRRAGFKGKVIAEVEEPREVIFEIPIELHCGGRIISVLQVPFPEEAAPEFGEQGVSTTRGISNFLHEYRQNVRRAV